MWYGKQVDSYTPQLLLVSSYKTIRVYTVFCFPWTCRAIAYSATGNAVFDLNVDPAANDSAGIGNDTTLQTCASSGMAGAIVAVPNDNQVSWKRRYV